MNEAQKNEIAETLKDVQYGYDDEFPEDSDVIMIDDKGKTQLCFQVSYAINQYIDPIVNKVSTKIKQLVKEAQ